MTSRTQVIAFSAGDPPPADLRERGLSKLHIDDGVLRVARSILSEGYNIAYAGDLRGGGFATDLSDDTGKVVLGPRFISFLGWPFADTLSPARIADTLGLCRYVILDPQLLTTSIITPTTGTPEWNWKMACCTRQTRQSLFSKKNFVDLNMDRIEPRTAQVLFAGKSNGFLGFMPGIAEEFLCAMQENLAIYIVGAFGGAASKLAESLTTGQISPIYQIDYHRDEDNFNRMLKGADLAKQTEKPIAYFEELSNTLKRVHEDHTLLNNGLGRAENDSLMTTSDIGKVIRLIKKGMRACHLKEVC